MLLKRRELYYFTEKEKYVNYGTAKNGCIDNFFFFQMIVLLGTKVALRSRYSIFKMKIINYDNRLVKQSDTTCVKKSSDTLESKGYIHDNKYLNVIE